MLDRLLLVALTPLALAGGTTTSWLQGQWTGQRSPVAVDAAHTRASALIGRPADRLAIHRGGDGLLHTTVNINDVPVDMVVDTGASRTILSMDDAERVLAVPSGRPGGKIITLGGQRDLEIRSVGSVEFAGRRFDQLEAGLVAGSRVSVIGLDWLALSGPITISVSA